MTRLFGTNGVRGVVNESLTPELALGLGKAIGTQFGAGEVGMATDPRTSNRMFLDAVASGLLSTGCGVIDFGMIPTPALQLAVKSRDLAGGVVITASHNPPEFNGIKCIDDLGMECSRETEEAIEDIYFNTRFATVPWDRVGGVRSVTTAARDYVDAVVSRVDAEAIARAKLTVYLDCGNGAACVTSPRILSRLGCRTVTLNGEPDGTFPGRESEPTPDHLADLLDAMKGGGADLGVAHDGDGDRTIFVDAHGDYVMGDSTLALMAKTVTEQKGGGVVVTPVSSSSSISDVVEAAGGVVIRTKVGAPIVARTMLERGAIFGGESNGGLIFPEHQLCRDGGLAMAKVIEVMATTGRPLADLLADLPTYAIHHEKIPLPSPRAQEILDAYVASLPEADLVTVDGVRVNTPGGWVLVRPSGTEPLLRIYSEAKDVEAAVAQARETSRRLNEIIQGLDA
jgi:phosphomannomutase/phosphoglucomutase